MFQLTQEEEDLVKLVAEALNQEDDGCNGIKDNLDQDDIYNALDLLCRIVDDEYEDIK